MPEHPYTGARVAVTLWNGEPARGVILEAPVCRRHGQEFVIRLDHDAVTATGEFTDMVCYPVTQVNVLEN